MPQWFVDLTSSQLWASLRHWITFVIGLAGGIGIVTVVQQHDAIVAINDISDGLIKIATGIGTLLTIFAPIINGWISARKSDPKNQASAVGLIANDPRQPKSTEAKVALLAATASISELKSPIVVSDPSLAAAVPGPKVIAK
jgi:hypothetical protein